MPKCEVHKRKGLH